VIRWVSGALESDLSWFSGCLVFNATAASLFDVLSLYCYVLRYIVVVY